MSAAQSARPASPRALTGSDEARRKAAVILEAFAGLRTTRQASDELGIALPRYYVLETCMLQAMVDALEPRARGRKPAAEAELHRLQGDNTRLRRELSRLQALYRTAQRAVGVKPPPKPPAKGKTKTTKVRRSRKQSRGERVLRTLQSQLSEPSAPGSKMVSRHREA